MNLLNRIQSELQQQRDSGRWRQVKTRQQGQGRYLVEGNRRWLNFASNDYLGLAQHPDVKQAAAAAAQAYGVGSGGSALITGHHQVHAELEAKLKELTGKPRILLFNSGFSANLGVLASLMVKGDLIIQDKLNHASLIDGGLSSKAQSARFLHNDLASAKRQLQREANGKLLVTESVFSMDGDEAPLAELSKLCHTHDALLMVDDAHGIGVIGKRGKGACHLTPSPHIDIYMATFGKALGVGGAMVACSDEVADYLIQFGRHFIYTTNMPIPQAASVSEALTCLDKHPDLNLKLLENISRFRELATQAGLELMPSKTAIQPLQVAGNERVLKVADELSDLGIACGAIRSPTVNAGQERLRLTLSASHTTQDIKDCIAALAQVLCSHSGVVS